MNKRTKKNNKSHSSGQTRIRSAQELAVVATASTLEDARDYETLLKNNDIPAIVKERPNEFGDGTHSAVYVTDDMVDEAHVIIESQDAYDDFYDFGLDEENEDDLEGDIFED